MFRGACRSLAVGIAAFACGALALAALAACDGAHGKDSEPTPPPVLVVTEPVQRRTVPISADFVASTAAVQSVDVRARVQGTLDEVYFKEGTLVHEGQLLFQLQTDKYASSVRAAQASLAKANADARKARDSQPVAQAQAALDAQRADLERAELSVARLTPLAAAKAVPQKDLDNARASRDAARASVAGATAQLHDAQLDQSVGIQQAAAEIMTAQSQLSDARLNLGYTTIRAPVSGLIGFLQVDRGNVVGSAGDQILDTISTVDPMKITFSVDEVTYLALAGKPRDAHRRALAEQPLRLLLADDSVYPQPGRLYTVNRTLDAKTGTIVVEALFPNPDALLRPGQFARVRLVTSERRNAVLVPDTAVVRSQGTAGAYVVSPNRTVQLRPLSLGPPYRGYVVVDDGLKAGERVVTQGLQRVRPGMTVDLAPPARSGR